MYSGTRVRSTPRNHRCPETNERKFTRPTPLHAKAIGVCATIDTNSQADLSNVIEEIGPEICSIEGIDYATALEELVLNIRDGHAITVAPITQIGDMMQKAVNANKHEVPIREGSDVTITVGTQLFGSVRRSVRSHIRPYSGIRGEAKIGDFAWLGRNKNVLCATLDRSTQTYEDLLELQRAVIRGLANAGIKGCELYPPDHIVLMRSGSKRNPYILGEDTKKLALELLRENLSSDSHNLGSVALTGTTIVEREGPSEEVTPRFGDPRPPI